MSAGHCDELAHKRHTDIPGPWQAGLRYASGYRLLELRWVMRDAAPDLRAGRPLLGIPSVDGALAAAQAVGCFIAEDIFLGLGNGGHVRGAFGALRVPEP